jgi:hypothetical protein
MRGLRLSGVTSANVLFVVTMDTTTHAHFEQSRHAQQDDDLTPLSTPAFPKSHDYVAAMRLVSRARSV